MSSRRDRRQVERSWRLLHRASGQADLVARCRDHLEQVGLADRSHVRAGALSHGERRQLESAYLGAADTTELFPGRRR